MTVQGANGGIASTSRRSCRLQLSDNAVGKKVFQIGECQDRMNIRNITIYANSALENWTQTVGVEAIGAAPNSTYHTSFKNVTFYGLGKGISVVADLDRDPVQGWQFDSIRSITASSPSVTSASTRRSTTLTGTSTALGSSCPRRGQA